MPSSGVSLKPPLKAFVRGVRIARVITMSSGFLVVLLSTRQCLTPKCCSSAVRGELTWQTHRSGRA